LYLKFAITDEIGVVSASVAIGPAQQDDLRA
jgi:hypothetical protein